MSRLSATAARSVLAAVAMVGFVRAANAETMVEYSIETRYQMDVHVNEAVLKAMLPAGFESNMATTGAAKDANLRVVFIDRTNIVGPNNMPVGKGWNQLVYLAAPVRETATMATAQMILGGLTVDATDAPGPFGNYIQAVTHNVTRSVTEGEGAPTGEEHWVLAAPSGERFELNVKYERIASNKGNLGDTRFYSAKNPSFYQISRQEQVLDIQRNVTTTPADRVKDFSIKAGGGVYSKLFDGTEQWLSWDHIEVVNRYVVLPN